MADYFAHTVVNPVIPIGDVTVLERFLLARIFDSDFENSEPDTYYFTSYEGMTPSSR